MTARMPIALTAALSAAALVACGSESSEDSAAAPPATDTRADDGAQADGAGTQTAQSGRPRTIATGLAVPWGIDFEPGRNGDALVAERTTGRIIRIARPGGKKSVAHRIRGVATGSSEGGLLGLAVSPTYARDKLVYAYYTASGESQNRIVRFKLGGRPRTVLSGLQAAGIHNGGRIDFGPDGKLYATVGDAGDTSNAQNRSSQNGKILRMNPDGSPPADNPFRGSRVWSLGHRNPQGLAWDSKKRLWASEFGQNTFDEVNLIQKGKNYGWPDVEGRGDTQGGKFVNPKITWRTSDASPSGDAISKGRLFVAALGGEGLFRSRLNGTDAGRPVKLYSGRYGRIRTVVKAPDGSVWFSTSNRDGRGDPKRGDDRILRIR
ncbi:MAG TPA: PQQ-dependent sugar dehydrogenase [Thermoleophilaceae bacterium]|nr:PQQ-dependent sugar dehydrogenase [Thermoleophilaceae bacterium]